MARPVVFWFEFASTYSYLSAMRVEDEAAKLGVEVIWRPFLLGPIFHAQGWDNSPFNIYPAKGRYMWRDMARRAETFGLAFQRPDVFPQNSLLAARAATAALHEDWGKAFCRRIYQAQFAEGKDISYPDVVASCIEAAGGVAQTFMFSAYSDSQKAALRANVEEAQAKGIFGAPSFTVGEELFWGDDRLEEALNWAAKA